MLGSATPDTVSVGGIAEGVDVRDDGVEPGVSVEDGSVGVGSTLGEGSTDGEGDGVTDGVASGVGEAQWSSLMPPRLPCSSQSAPWDGCGSGRQVAVEFPRSHHPCPGGLVGLPFPAALVLSAPMANKKIKPRVMPSKIGTMFFTVFGFSLCERFSARTVCTLQRCSGGMLDPSENGRPAVLRPGERSTASPRT